MFKRIFGTPDESPQGLNVGRLATPASPERPGVADESAAEMPTKKPPARVDDLQLPETLAEAAAHPESVDVRFVLGPTRPDSTTALPPVPNLTDEQLEAIAQRVADRLASGVIGDRLREAVTRIVSETSERLVREEIARVRGDAALE